jgi:hypothetical protein
MRRGVIIDCSGLKREALRPRLTRVSVGIHVPRIQQPESARKEGTIASVVLKKNAMMMKPVIIHSARRGWTHLQMINKKQFHRQWRCFWDDDLSSL